jgi:hypothetical protein
MKFAILHVAVDNDVFARLPRCCIVMSAAVPAEARQRRIVKIFATFAENHFLAIWACERHWTCTKLKGTGCYSQATNKVEL